jgi:hypothetical protein
LVLCGFPRILVDSFRLYLFESGLRFALLGFSLVHWSLAFCYTDAFSRAKKQKLTLSVDVDLIKKGRELGFNFSELLGRVLKEEIRLHGRAFEQKEDGK